MTDETITHYFLTAFRAFEDDPPDTLFQRGYLAALLAVGRDLKLDIDFDLWEKRVKLARNDQIKERDLAKQAQS